ncbi:MAG: aminomethyl-transferring glycine dehydrogenase [Planctomycetota bacterium]|jgi:glycine dehydrogenase|nr:aminomethyl-transferring glycine dehydrogenase [Planctomycetota bacterium]
MTDMQLEARPHDSVDNFLTRHLGPGEEQQTEMLEALGLSSLEELTERVVPESIRMQGFMKIDPARTEHDILDRLRTLASENRLIRSYLGMGYHGTRTPPVIQRGILENPGWYTQYTPYQAEIAQGRLEALMNFQTMITDLTGMEVAGSSLLDEGTAAAEGMTLCHRVRKSRDGADVFFVSSDCHPQTIEVVRGRALPLGFEVVVGSHEEYAFDEPTFGVLLQYPASDGRVEDLEEFVKRAHEAGAMVVVAADLLALTMLRPPGSFGADVVVGNSQRLGVPMGYGGPHAAFLATHSAHQRKMPGRIVGVSVDASGGAAFRLALQTREQHIRRDRATSNICTAQVLLAVTASMYAVYHGPEGLLGIARRLHRLTRTVARKLEQAGHAVVHDLFFDTLRIRPERFLGSEVVERALKRGINLRLFGNGDVGIALDETVEISDLPDLLGAFGWEQEENVALVDQEIVWPSELIRTSSFLDHPIFRQCRSETELLRYMHRLQARDLSLTTSMIPLGSCTMKLNATTEMVPVTWPEFGALHPFVPANQARGYRKLFAELESWLGEITGLPAVSLQPNAGSQGEYAGLLLIRAYQHARGEGGRNVCLIPTSAHGTNPASAVLAGMRTVAVACDEEGNIDIGDLRNKAETHQDKLAAMMITYPSTHGVFEEGIVEICRIVHEFGGQVYLDGANMNAMVGLIRLSDLGADVCHLNLHKTFCIPHGGGGPGMGPICAAKHLAPFLPGHPLETVGGENAILPVASAPWGSPSILPISYAYVAMMGPEGLRKASQVAILNANYMAHRLASHYDVLYRGKTGFVAHEFILDLRPLTQASGVGFDDVAKRLMDYGFHAPTMSWPVSGTLMIEPTESESRAELDRFCEAMIGIRGEIQEIIDGNADREKNLLSGAPHTAEAVSSDEWNRPYSRERAAFPTSWTRKHKYWPPVSRIDNVHGDRNPICCLVPVFDVEGDTPDS